MTHERKELSLNEHRYIGRVIESAFDGIGKICLKVSKTKDGERARNSLERAHKHVTSALIDLQRLLLKHYPDADRVKVYMPNFWKRRQQGKEDI